MQPLTTLLKTYQTPTSFTSERQEIIESFVKKINLDREGTAYKPVSWVQINGLLRKKQPSELYGLFKACEGGGCAFSKVFFGVLKKK